MSPWWNYRTFSPSLTGHQLLPSPHERSSICSSGRHTHCTCKANHCFPLLSPSAVWAVPAPWTYYSFVSIIKSLCSWLREGCWVLALVYTEKKKTNPAVRQCKPLPCCPAFNWALYYARCPGSCSPGLFRTNWFFIVTYTERTSLEWDLWQVNCSSTWSLPQISSNTLCIYVPPLPLIATVQVFLIHILLTSTGNVRDKCAFKVSFRSVS